MDKEFLKRVNDSLKQIKTKLLLDADIRKMLYYDMIDDATIAPVIDQVKDHIYLQPIIKVETTEPFNKKNYITLTIPEGDLIGNKMEYVVRVVIMCDKSTWALNGDIRPILMAQKVANILDGFKTEFSNSLQFSNIVETVTSKDVVGYSMLFNTSDGISDVNEK